MVIVRHRDGSFAFLGALTGHAAVRSDGGGDDPVDFAGPFRASPMTAELSALLWAAMWPIMSRTMLALWLDWR